MPPFFAMKSKSSQRILREVFGDDYKDYLQEATEPFPIVLSWKCIAKGRRSDPKGCIFEQGLEENPTVDRNVVFPHFSYIRFKGSKTIWRYKNSEEMATEINEFDRTGFTGEYEEGDTYTLDPLAKIAARSLEYQHKRREAIKNGTHVVKPRGPNPNMRRLPVHHFRPH